MLRNLDENSPDSDLEIFSEITHTTQDCYTKFDPDFLRHLMNTRPIFFYVIEEDTYRIAISYQHSSNGVWRVKSSAADGDISPLDAVRIMSNHYALFMQENGIKEMLATVLKTYEHNKRFQGIRDNLKKVWTTDAEGNPISGRSFAIKPATSHIHDHFLLRMD